MTKKGSQELRECRAELRSIISSLETLERNIRNDFKNVGNVQCANSIHSVIEKYRSALSTLNSVDASVLDQLKKAAEDAQKALQQGGGGRTSGGGARRSF